MNNAIPVALFAALTANAAQADGPNACKLQDTDTWQYRAQSQKNFPTQWNNAAEHFTHEDTSGLGLPPEYLARFPRIAEAASSTFGKRMNTVVHYSEGALGAAGVAERMLDTGGQEIANAAANSNEENRNPAGKRLIEAFIIGHKHSEQPSIECEWTETRKDFRGALGGVDCLVTTNVYDGEPGDGEQVVDAVLAQIAMIDDLPVAVRGQGPRQVEMLNDQVPFEFAGERPNLSAVEEHIHGRTYNQAQHDYDIYWNTTPTQQEQMLKEQDERGVPCSGGEVALPTPESMQDVERWILVNGEAVKVPDGYSLVQNASSTDFDPNSDLTTSGE